MSQTPVAITTGTGSASVAAELVSGTSFQQIEVYGGGGASVLSVNPDGSFKASIIGTPTVSFSGSPSISGAVTIVGAPTVAQSGTWNVSIVSTIPSSVIVGSSIFGQLPAGTAAIGSIAALQGTTPWLISSVYGNISGSVASFQAGAWTTSVVGTITASVQGNINIASVIGTVPVTVVGSVLSLQAPAASIVSGISSVITGTAVTSVLAAAPGGQRNYVTNILVTNQQTSVTGAGSQVNIIDDGSGQVMYAGYAAAGGGGFSLSFPTPLRQPTSTFSVSAKSISQASILVGISGYTGS